MPGDSPEAKTYKVWSKSTTYYYAEIVAESAEAAERLADTEGHKQDWESPDPYDGEWEVLFGETEEG